MHRAFTPQLAKWYRRLRDGIVGDRFSIIFASSDRDEESFKDYFKTMPWLALPFADRERKVSDGWISSAHNTVPEHSATRE